MQGGRLSESEKAEIALLKELVEIHKSNLSHLELTKARFGMYVPPYILEGIREERAEIARIESEIAAILNGIRDLETESHEASPSPTPAYRLLVKSTKYREQMTRYRKQMNEYQERMNEWKEVHDLLQELSAALALFYREISREREMESKDRSSQDLWESWQPCRKRIEDLKKFAREIKCIGEPYREREGKLYGEEWVVKVVRTQKDLEAALKGDNRAAAWECTSELNFICDTELDHADKKLKKLIEELRISTDLIHGVTGT